VVIPIPTVEGDSFTSALSTTIKNNDIVVTDNNFEVEFNFRAIRHTKGSPLNEGALGTLIIQRSTDSGETWNEVGTIKNVLRSNEPNDTTTVQKVNIG
jgi:hypothetical protein